MDLTKAIIALLEAKFQGVRKDVLTNLASSIALQAEDEKEAKTIVDRMTAEKVNGFAQSYRSSIDREIQQSVQTNEQKLREKYNFTEKQSQQQQQPGGLTIDQIKEIFREQLDPLTQRMDAYDKQKSASARRDLYVGKMKEAKLSEVAQNILLQQFDRMNFSDDADFNQFLADSQPTFAKMVQDDANARLRMDGTPSFGKTDDKGVSQGMKDYLESKTKNNGQVEGKAL